MHSKTDYSILLSNDYDLLTNIFHSYDRTCISWTYKEHLSMPVNEKLTLKSFLNASANMYMGLIHFFKSIPEFGELSVQSKLSLIKSNLNQLLRVHSTFMMKIITPDLDRDSPVFLHLFPKDLYFELRSSATALIPFVHDRVLIKLFITVLMLSTHLQIQYEQNSMDYNDEYSIRKIFHVQNIYIDLLWRYIRSHTSNYKQSILLLNSFITRTLSSQLVQVKMNNFIRSILPIESQSLEPIIESIWTSEKENHC